MRNNFVFYPYFENHLPSMAPPTLLSILNSYVNYGKDKKTGILDLSAASRDMVFDFSYPLSDYINKEDFEIMFLDQFLDRRIGTETFTAWKLHLRSKLRQIMPSYNMMFDALGEKFDILKGDGYTKTYTEREDELTEQSMSTDGSTESSGETKRKYSDTPQGQLSNVDQGTYLTDYTDTEDSSNISTQSSSEGSTDRGKDRTYTEIHNSHVANLDALIRFREAALDIYGMIWKDCDDLFYQIME